MGEDDGKLAPLCVKWRESSGGVVIVIVVVVALIGFLFGLGRLLAFRFQCERRLDREDELSRIMATRSAMQFMCVDSWTKLTNASWDLCYKTHNARDIDVKVTPSPPVDLFYFKSDAPANCQQCIGWGKASNPTLPFWGAISNLTGKGISLWPITGTGLEIEGTNFQTGESAVFGVEWDGEKEKDVAWVNTVYGRRYLFRPIEPIPAAYNEYRAGTGDVIRLMLVAKRLNSSMDTDFMTGSAIALEQTTHGANVAALALLYRQTNVTGWTSLRQSLPVADWKDFQKKGVQISGTKITLCCWENFSKMRVDDVQYDLPAWTTNEFKEVRMFVEVERRVASSTNSTKTKYVLQELSVEPAFEFSCTLSWQSRKGNATTSEVSTVMHVTPKYRDSLNVTFPQKVVTYDTHGTTAK